MLFICWAWTLQWLGKYILLKGNQKVSSSKEITVLEGSGTTETGSETIEGLCRSRSKVCRILCKKTLWFLTGYTMNSADSLGLKRKRLVMLHQQRDQELAWVGIKLDWKTHLWLYAKSS